MSSPRTLSPTPPPRDSPRRAAVAAEPAFSTSSQKERTLVSCSPSSPTTAAAPGPGPMDARIDPPTIEELEAMELEPGARWQEGEICETPSASEISANSKICAPTFSRQVSRVSGTGRIALQHAKPKGVLVPMPARTGGVPQRGRTMHQAPLMIEQGKGGGARIQPRSNLSRRSISADDMDRRFMMSQSRAHRQDGLQRGEGPNGYDRRRSPTRGQGQPFARQRVAPPPEEGGPPTSTQGLQKGNSRKARQRGGQREAAASRGTAASRRGAPYNAQGTPSAWKDNRPNQQQQHQQEAPRYNGQGGAAPSAGDIVVRVQPTLRRRNSAPSMSDVAQEFETAEQQSGGGRELSSQVESSRGSETCWGGGLPSARNAIALGPSAARAMAARAPATTTDKFSESRYPANDRESFARTLNDEELDEVWQGLGEGVSQRGCGSEVSFVAPPPGSPGTAVGAFPMLTANVLEKHDQLAVSGAVGVRAEQRPPNVMPIPKDIGDKAAHDMENGTPSSKKSGGSDSAEGASLLATVVSYGMLVLWMAHLVFNALLLWPILMEHPVWALCLLPGALGILLSLNACRKRHHQCKPPAEGERAGSRRRHGPHPCALPIHMVLLFSVVVALGMHASALLFCEKDMQLFIAETTVDPLCSETFLLLPVILDGVMLSVASLKASSLCWAWVLS